MFTSKRPLGLKACMGKDCMWLSGLLATVVPTDPAGGYLGPNPHGNSLKAFRPGF